MHYQLICYLCVMMLSVSVSSADAEPSSGTLNDAYKKEYAFLATQQRELSKRAQALTVKRKKEVGSMVRKISRLENETINMATEIERMEQLLDDVQQAKEEQEEASDSLEMMYTQAKATLTSYKLPINDLAFDSADTVNKLQQVFSKAQQLLKQTNSIQTNRGQFYLQDGTETQGLIVQIGKIAAYGVSDLGSGALVPAGDGLLKLWNQPAQQTAIAFSQGEQPDILSTFLFESTEKAIEEKKQKTVYDTINDGGIIAWIIVGLGVIAMFLVVLRSLYLLKSSVSAGRLADKVSDYIETGNVQAAQSLCQQSNGPIAQVLSAAIRNLDKDRDHLEDVVSEAILHESSHLNRFGSLILLVAAVAPLLGLLGTVTGMIATFEIITEFGTGDPKLLSGGISIALITTEVGLAIAIPTLMLGTLLSGWAESIKDTMEQAALTVSNLYFGKNPRAVNHGLVANEPHLVAVSNQPVLG